MRQMVFNFASNSSRTACEDFGSHSQAICSLYGIQDMGAGQSVTEQDLLSNCFGPLLQARQEAAEAPAEALTRVPAGSDAKAESINAVPATQDTVEAEQVFVASISGQ